MQTTNTLVLLTAALIMATNPSHASELLLDWDTLTWQPEGQTNLSETYAIGGRDVIVAIGGNTSGLDNLGTLSPRIDSTQTGGLTPVEDALIITTDYPAGTVDREVTISFDFSDYAGGISDVAFSLFDIDSNASAIDEVMITALVNGTLVDPTSLVAGSANQVVGSNTIVGTGISPPSSSDGNVSIAFAYTGITELLITYRNGGQAFSGGLQTMGIHDISYTVVPLPAGLWLLGSALVALAHQRRR